MSTIVCSHCFNDKYLKEYVKNDSSLSGMFLCAYCGRKSNDCIPLFQVAEYIKKCFSLDYHDSHGPGFQSEFMDEEGSDSVSTSTSKELLKKYNVTSLPQLINDLSKEIGSDITWCDRNSLELSENLTLTNNWKYFKHCIMSKCRYFYFHKSYHGDEEILQTISKAIEHFNLVETINNREIYRARRNRLSGPHYQTAEELGPPDETCARHHNRMSAAGIPIFYGAFDPETAIKETYDYFKETTSFSVGTFRPTKDLRLVNFSKLPNEVSIFDAEHNEFRGVFFFLRDFVKELSLPIKKDGEEHLEYLPTQVLAEYLRYVFRDKNGHEINGIIYKSAVSSGKDCCAIFCTNEECEDEDKYHELKDKDKKRKTFPFGGGNFGVSRFLLPASKSSKILLILKNVDVFMVSSKLSITITPSQTH